MQQQQDVQITIKSLEDKIQSIENLLEKGSDCLIFQYGSHSIKFNRAHENNPLRLRNLIAYRKNQVIQQEKQTESLSLDTMDESLLNLESKLRAKGTLRNEPKVYKGKPRAKIEIDLRNMTSFTNKKSQNNSLCPFKNDIENKNILFEDDIYTVEQRDDYEVRQPIKYGFFNLTNGQTINDVIDDLYKLTIYAVTSKLGITMNQLQNYSCIIIIPDIFQRLQCVTQIKALIDMLLRQIGFKSIYLHLESIMATFGSNIQQACVVDIGYEKINVCCVDEGIIYPGYFSPIKIQLYRTYLRKNFGSKDLDLVLLRQIERRNAYSKASISLNQNYFGDLQQMEKLKEKSCQLVQKDDKSNYLYELHCVRNNNEERFQIQHNDSLYLTPHAWFDVDCLNKYRQKQINHECFDFTSRMFEMYYDQEDNLEDLSGGVQLSFLWGSKEKEQQYCSNIPETQQILSPFHMVPLDQMIAYSLQQVKNIEKILLIFQVQDSELRQKLAQNILLVGGGCHLQDLLEELQILLIDTMTEFELNDIERGEVKSMIRDVRPQCLAWVGATVLPKTDCMQEMWISKQRWLGNLDQSQQKDEVEDILEQYDGDVGALEKKMTAILKKEKDKDKSAEYGIKYLKEKIPFVW